MISRLQRNGPRNKYVSIPLSTLFPLPNAFFRSFGYHTVAGFQYSITKEVIWPLMDLMESTSPSSYHAVLELDKKLHELSAAINIYEDEQFNATAASLEWNCILGASVRQAGECRPPLLPMPSFSSPERAHACYRAVFYLDRNTL